MTKGTTFVLINWEPATFEVREPWTVGPFADDGAAFEFIEKAKPLLDVLGGWTLDPEQPLSAIEALESLEGMVRDY